MPMPFLVSCGGAKQVASSAEVQETPQVVEEEAEKQEITETPARKEADFREISQEEAARLMHVPNVLVLDVRSQEEYDAGHIKGAICIPHDSIGDLADERLPDKEQVILLYCRWDNCGKKAAKELLRLGYRHVYDFGDIENWTGEIVVEDGVSSGQQEQTDAAEEKANEAEPTPEPTDTPSPSAAPAENDPNDSDDPRNYSTPEEYADHMAYKYAEDDLEYPDDPASRDWDDLYYHNVWEEAYQAWEESREFE